MRASTSFPRFVLALLLLACDARTSTENTTPPHPAPGSADSTRLATPAPATQPADTAVASAWRQLEKALRNHDAPGVVRLIDPAVGLWILEQPGAVPAVTRVTNVEAFRRSYQELTFFSVAEQLMSCPQLRGLPELPEVDCGYQTEQNAGFELVGCLTGPATGFRQLDLWPYASVKGGTAAQGQAAQQRCTHTVLQTRTGFRFHFAKPPGAAGQWRLIFIDLRQPCTA